MLTEEVLFKIYELNQKGIKTSISILYDYFKDSVEKDYFYVIINRLNKKKLIKIIKKGQYKITEKGILKIKDLIEEYEKNKDKEIKEKTEKEIQELIYFIFDGFLLENKNKIKKVNENYSFTLDFKELADYVIKQHPNIVPKKLESLGLFEIVFDYLIDKIDDSLALLKSIIKNNYIDDSHYINSNLNPVIIFKNVDKVCTDIVKDINKLRHNDISKLRVVKGEITSRSDSLFMLNIIKFECLKCGSIVPVYVGDRMKNPVCPNCGNRSPKKFMEINSERVDVLKMCVRDIYEYISSEDRPEEVNVIIKEDIFNFEKLIEGEAVKLIGILRVSRKPHSNIEIKEFEVLGIEKIATDFKNIKISDSDLEKIKEISKNPIEYFKSLLFSDYVGNDLAIETALLCLFEKIHLLFLGEPSTGKTDILRRISEIAIKGKFVEAMTSSASGLIGSVVKNKYTEKYSLDSSPIRFAHPDGLVVIDEINRGNDDIQAILLGVMQNEILTITKATIRVSMPAKVSILATANPKPDYKYENSEPLRFNMIQPLWERFDLKLYFKKEIKLKEFFERLNKKKKINIPETEKDIIRKYLVYARSREYQLNNDWCYYTANEVKDFIDESNNNYRFYNMIPKLYKAYARMYLKDSIDKDVHIKVVNLLKNILKTKTNFYLDDE